jgi:hypothetical protein
MKGPGLAEFLFQSQVLTLYRKMLKISYRVKDRNVRMDTVAFFKKEFSLISLENKTQFSFVRNSVNNLAEMLYRSGGFK